jgi:tetratricopeptide (TPR) repeat protein
MSWVSRVMGDAELTLTVCTGAFVPARAGLLDGKTATTWYGAIEGLRLAAPTATIQEGRRFVDGGKLVTTAGVSAGIDGALHVVARLLGRSTADRTARYMEYHWAPESYLAQQYSQFNPDLDEGHRAVSKALYDEADRHFEVAAAEWRAILGANPTDGAAWYHLGFALHSLHHYDEAAEAATKATQAAGLSPERRATAWYNVACARSLQGRKDEALLALEKAVNAGFSPRRLDGDPDLDLIRNDPRFVALASR